MQKLVFSGRPLKVDLASIIKPEIGAPFLYILTDLDSKAPFYVGEYGKSGTYNVITRIKRHFSNSGTLARVALNLPKFDHVIPESFNAYIKELPSEFQDVAKRASLEAWLIYKICHIEKIQDPKFCVTKYIAPTENFSFLSAKILEEFKNHI